MTPTTTAADGTFTFNNVPPSGTAGYTVTEVQPSGFTDGKTAVTFGQPGAPNSAKAVNVGDQDRVGGVVVAANTNRGDYIFGEVKPIPGLKPPIINGYVYLDRRHTCVRPTDGSVEGQGGWTVVLRQDNKAICTTTTNEKGFTSSITCTAQATSRAACRPVPASITFDKDGSNLPAVPTSGGNRGLVPRRAAVDPQHHPEPLRPGGGAGNLPLDLAGTIYNLLTRATVAP